MKRTFYLLDEGCQKQFDNENYKHETSRYIIKYKRTINIVEWNLHTLKKEIVNFPPTCDKYCVQDDELYG